MLNDPHLASCQQVVVVVVVLLLLLLLLLLIIIIIIILKIPALQIPPNPCIIIYTPLHQHGCFEFSRSLAWNTSIVSTSTFPGAQHTHLGWESIHAPKPIRPNTPSGPKWIKIDKKRFRISVFRQKYAPPSCWFAACLGLSYAVSIKKAPLTISHGFIHVHSCTEVSLVLVKKVLYLKSQCTVPTLLLALLHRETLQVGLAWIVVRGEVKELEPPFCIDVLFIPTYIRIQIHMYIYICINISIYLSILCMHTYDTYIWQSNFILIRLLFSIQYILSVSINL